jgi:hypothetical protein
VCEAERERGGSVVFLPSVLLNNNATIIPIYFLVACVTSEEEREGKTEDRLALLLSCGTLAALPTGKDTKLKDISCKPVFVLSKQIFWVVAPSG